MQENIKIYYIFYITSGTLYQGHIIIFMIIIIITFVKEVVFL